MMKLSSTFTVGAVAAALASGALFITSAHAGGAAKEYFVQDYRFAKPMHGYSGHSGNYYCDYQRLPNRKCVTNANGTESCKIVGWTLRQSCQ